MRATTDTALVPNRINHFVLVADMSASMTQHSRALVQVVDNFVADLAVRSRELDQETRVTVYTFNSTSGVTCLVYDMDALRKPTIGGRFRPSGLTPLIDASWQAIEELGETPERYGEHSFVVFVLTDGMENASRHAPHQLEAKITGLPDHWTVAAFVPDSMGVAYAKKCGFPAGNIDKWDTTSAHGVTEVGDRIRAVSDDFMQARTRGVRGSRNLFQVAEVSAQKLQATLPPLTHGSYWFADVPADSRIDEFIASATGRAYQTGTAYYQLSKAETVQPYKQVAIQVAGGEVYTGKAARSMLGLPDHELRVRPSHQPGTTIFIQSTSYNRKLIGGTRVLILR